MGLLSCDVLEYLRKIVIISKTQLLHRGEKGTKLRDEQKKRLTEKVQWIDSIKTFVGDGLHFFNELVDAFPVHIGVMENELMEFSLINNGSFFRGIKTGSE